MFPIIIHDIPEGSISNRQALLGIAFLLVVLWAFITFLQWISPLNETITLVQVIQNQGKWLVGLSKRIW